MISYFQAIIIGGMQGIAELFPISSLGHSVILPKLLGWNIDQGATSFLIFLVATHLATALVLLGFFFKDWVLIVKGMLRSLKMRRIDPADAYTRLGWLIVVSSIPAGILGLLFEEKLKQLFASPMIAALFLTINGLLLFDAEILRKNATKNETVASASMSAKIETDSRSDETIAKITWNKR